jgi:hypothetical protein
MLEFYRLKTPLKNPPFRILSLYRPTFAALPQLNFFSVDYSHAGQLLGHMISKVEIIGENTHMLNTFPRKRLWGYQYF